MTEEQEAVAAGAGGGGLEDMGAVFVGAGVGDGAGGLFGGWVGVGLFSA